ncbi:MAG: hypothetical protein NTY77_19060 [Elusimicrobia bacterium]|nr:hypothetical protein [Elusimicrobiota bacterium]
MKRRVLAALLSSISLFLAGTAGFCAAQTEKAAAEQAFTEKLTTALATLQSDFAAAGLEPSPLPALKDEFAKIHTSSPVLAGLWKSCEKISHGYEAFRSDFLTIPAEDLGQRVQDLGRDMGVPEETVKTEVVPRYRRLQAACLQAKLTWSQGGLRKPDGSALTDAERQRLRDGGGSNWKQVLVSYSPLPTLLKAGAWLSKPDTPGEAETPKPPAAEAPKEAVPKKKAPDGIRLSAEDLRALMAGKGSEALPEGSLDPEKLASYSRFLQDLARPDFPLAKALGPCAVASGVISGGKLELALTGCSAQRLVAIHQWHMPFQVLVFSGGQAPEKWELRGAAKIDRYRPVEKDGVLTYEHDMEYRSDEEGGSWRAAATPRAEPAPKQEPTSLGKLKDRGQSGLQTLGAAAAPVFDKFQGALYYLAAVGPTGRDVKNPEQRAAVNVFNQHYSDAQAEAKLKGAELKDKEQLLALYRSAMEKLKDNPSGRRFMEQRLDERVREERKKLYGEGAEEVAEIAAKQAVTDEEKAFAAAGKYGVGNLTKNLMENGAAAWEDGDKFKAAAYFLAAGALTYSETRGVGGVIGGATTPLKMGAALKSPLLAKMLAGTEQSFFLLPMGDQVLEKTAALAQALGKGDDRRAKEQAGDLYLIGAGMVPMAKALRAKPGSEKETKAAKAEPKKTSPQPPAELKRYADVPQIDLARDFKSFNETGSQGVIYQSPADPNTVVKFFKSQSVTQAHVQELVRINEQLRARGVPVVKMELVQNADGALGVRMPRVQGRPLLSVINKLNPGDSMTDRTASGLQRQAFETLGRIDAVTEQLTGKKLADRRQGFLNNDEDFANFMVAGGKLVDIDPLDITRVKEAMSEPGYTPVAPARAAPASPPSQALTARLAGLLHDEWRAPRKIPGTERYEPRIKTGADGKTQVDIANLPYEKLPEQFKAENRESARVTMDLIADRLRRRQPLDAEFIEKASSVLHDKWVERNASWAPDEQKVPFEKLTPEEAEKDRVIIRKGVDLYRQRAAATGDIPAAPAKAAGSQTPEFETSAKANSSLTLADAAVRKRLDEIADTLREKGLPPLTAAEESEIVQKRLYRELNPKKGSPGRKEGKGGFTVFDNDAGLTQLPEDHPAIMDHHGRYFDSEKPEVNSTMKFLDHIEAFLKDPKNQDLTEEQKAARLKQDFARVSTNNLGDGAWCVWIAKNLDLVARDPALRQRIRLATGFEDFGFFGPKAYADAKSDPALAQAIELQQSIFKGYDQILRKYGVKDSDRFDRLPAAKQRRLMDETLQFIGQSLDDPAFRGRNAKAFAAEVEQARQNVRAAEIKPSVPGLEDVFVFDADKIPGGGLFANWGGPPLAHGKSLQLSFKALAEGRTQFILAVPNGAQAPSLKPLGRAIQKAHEAKAQKMGITDDLGAVLGRDALQFSFSPGLLLTPQEIMGVLARQRHLPSP